MMENDCYPGDAAFTEDLIRMLGEPTPSADKTAVWRMKSIIPAFQ
jgi:hypothetical protein